MRLLDIKDLSQQLNIKPSTLYAWVAQGKIPYVKIHGLIRFVQDEIERWVTSFRKERANSSIMVPKKRNHRKVDILIERAKQDVYNIPYGRPDRIRAGKDGD